MDKRRAGNAPEGFGVPVGTEYHWYIVAHQIVKKVDANKYTTTMTGIKYKLAHKRAEQEIGILLNIHSRNYQHEYWKDW
ncbi:MAG: hypothetical protein ACRD5E_09455 [Nitrososphaeraceae archaeon]